MAALASFTEIQSPAYSLSRDVFPDIIKYLPFGEACLAARVCKSWNAAINEAIAADCPEIAASWYQYFQLDSVKTVEPYLRDCQTELVDRYIAAKNYRQMDSAVGITDKIIEYYGSGRKEIALSITTGRLVLGDGAASFCHKVVSGYIPHPKRQTSWESCQPEVFLDVRVIGPSRPLPLGFPRLDALPLRFFYDLTGEPKRTDDKVRLVFGQRLIMLTLATKEGEPTDFKAKLLTKLAKLAKDPSNETGDTGIIAATAASKVSSIWVCDGGGNLAISQALITGHNEGALAILSHGPR